MTVEKTGLFMMLAIIFVGILENFGDKVLIMGILFFIGACAFFLGDKEQ